MFKFLDHLLEHNSEVYTNCPSSPSFQPSLSTHLSNPRVPDMRGIQGHTPVTIDLLWRERQREHSAVNSPWHLVSGQLMSPPAQTSKSNPPSGGHFHLSKARIALAGTRKARALAWNSGSLEGGRVGGRWGCRLRERDRNWRLRGSIREREREGIGAPGGLPSVQIPRIVFSPPSQDPGEPRLKTDSSFSASESCLRLFASTTIEPTGLELSGARNLPGPHRC